MSQQVKSVSDVLVRQLRRRLWVERVFWLLLLAGLGALHFGAMPSSRQAVLIAADGQPVTVVATRRDAQRLLDEIKTSSGLAADKVAFAQTVTFHPVPADRNPVQSDTEAMRALSSKLGLLVKAAAVVANGEVVIALPTQQEAVKTLSLLLEEFAPPGVTGNVYFKEQVKVEMRDVPPDKLYPSAQQAIEKVAKAAAPQTEYEVKPGDSAWKIATKYGVSLSRLAAANPDLDINRVILGEKIKIPGELPPLTVVARKEIEQPVSGPSGGMRRIRITYENGVEIKREVIGGRRPPAAPKGGARPQRREEEP